MCVDLCYYVNEFLYENTRVIAGAPAKTATADGVYVITFTTIGGDAAVGTGVDTEPCMLSATLKYNSDIRLPGWNAISMQHKAKIGGKKQGIRITSYSVKEVNPINPATCIIIK